MATGRPPIPTNLKLIKGTARKHRIKDEPKPAKPARVPSPPSHLGKMAKAEWRRVAKQLHALGLLTLVDKEALALYCKAVEDERVACGRLAKWNMAHPDNPNCVVSPISGAIRSHPFVHQRDVARKQIAEFAREFGMTPASRTRVSGAKHDGRDENPFQQFGPPR